MKNKFFATMLVAFLLAGNTAIPSYAADEKGEVIVLNIGKPTMLVSGVEKSIDSANEVTPVLVNDTTLVPIRAIIESLGGKVEWDEIESKVTVLYNDKVVILWLDKNSAIVNEKEINANVAPTTINGRTMIPLRFVSENLGLFVNWEGRTNAISISTSSNYIAIVGGVKINTAEYNICLSRAKNEIVNYLVQNNVIENNENSNWNTQINGVKSGDLAKQNALEYARQHRLLFTKAVENNITMSEEELINFDTSISNMIQDEGGLTAAEKKVMDYNNVNLSEYTTFINENIIIDKYLKSLLNKLKVTDEEVLNFYNINKASLEKVTVKHILVSTTKQNTNTPVITDDEAKKKAEDILYKVKEGEDFAALAKQYSEDPGSKDRGGEYTFARGEMVKEFENWSFQAKDGDIGIVKTAYGYHVMKFVGRNTFDDVKKNIQDYLTNQSLNTYIKEIISKPEYVAIKNQSVYDSIELK